jgi:hypothetical protein
MTGLTKQISGVFIAAILFLASRDSSQGQSIVLDKNEERVFSGLTWIPYGFYSGGFGLGMGIGASYSKWPQEQASILGALTLGTKGSYNVVGKLSDYQMPGIPRLVINPFFSFGLYQDQRFYVGRDPAYGGERAGSNNSDPDHYIEATEWDNRAEIDFRFLLPVGHGKETIVNRYVIEKGLLTDGDSGAESWSPLHSGRTTFCIKPGWREQTLDRPDLNVPFQTFNVGVALEHNNYDFPFNPSCGSYKRIGYKKDFTSHNQLGGWEAWDLALNKVFNLGGHDWARQQVLALGFWTAYVPTWTDGTVDTIRRPPPYEGAVLGGIHRMRAYENDRFSDKAAIYYGAEYRIIPQWQPLGKQPWMDWADIGWWQWVLFTEAGQVAPSYRLDELHSHLHLDGGIGLRIMTHKAVCRVDFSAGEEGFRVVAMYGQPF